MNENKLCLNNTANSQPAKPLTNLPQDLATTIKLIYEPINFSLSQLLKELESEEYSAYSFKLNELLIRFRIAKTTPTKVGQFVTLWKRQEKGPIQPYDASDNFDFFVISTRGGNQFGQFVFPKTVLCEHDIISVDNKGGKRAIRVYPPWEKSLNKQAQKTQHWQLNYYLDIPYEKPVDYKHALQLYLLECI